MTYELFCSLSLKPISRMAKEESVFCGQVLSDLLAILIFHSFYFHAQTYKYTDILYLNTIRFKVFKLVGSCKIITNKHRCIFKIGMTLITK